MKLGLIFFLGLFFHPSLKAQVNDSIPLLENRTWNVLGVHPVNRSTTINGIAAGFYTGSFKDSVSLIVSGLNLEVSPMSILGLFYDFFGSFGFLNSQNANSMIERDPIRFVDIYPDSALYNGLTQVNGLSLSTGTVNDVGITGIGVNGLTGMINKCNGVMISGLLNHLYKFSGVLVAGFFNKVTVGEGLMVGLYNNAHHGHLLQIGLVNQVGKNLSSVSFASG